MTSTVSIVLPAQNEAAGLPELLARIREICPSAELILIDDGSDDDTALIAEAAGARVIRHPYPMGNGAAIKTGARNASGEILVFMDADGQHDPADIPCLLARIDAGHAMAVGARTAPSQASRARGWANQFYNRLASWMTGQPVADLTSGFRAVRAGLFREFLYLLPNGFSYPTTVTMAFFRSAYPVAYVPIVAGRRQGRSHIRPLRDGLRFLLIIFKIGTLFSPIKLFGPVSLFFLLTGLGHYAHTFVTEHRFTNMSALLLSAAVIVFLMGLISEQITQLQYSKR